MTESPSASTPTLVVCRQGEFRDAVIELLAQIDYQVDVVGEGSDGLDALSTGQYRVCLVHLDLPDVEGEQFVKLARRLSPWIQLIAVVPTGARMAELLSVLRLGACDVFDEEADPAEVAVSVGAAMARFARWKDLLGQHARKKASAKKASKRSSTKKRSRAKSKKAARKSSKKKTSV